MQGDEGAPDAWIDFEPDVLEALEGVNEGDRVVILTWLDRADREARRAEREAERADAAARRSCRGPPG